MITVNPCDQPGQLADYAIVGAGCSGLYCAWRLLTSANKPRLIYMFEKDKRVGGRLLSLNLLDKGRKAELGGMRFTDKQVLISELIRSFGMDKDHFDFKTRLMYLRARRLCHDQQDWLEKSTYTLASTEKMTCTEKTMSEIAIAVAKHGISNAVELLEPQTSEQKSCVDRLKSDLRRDTLTLGQWRDLQQNVPVKEVDRKLHELGFWNLLHRCLEPNDFLFLHDALGYESLLANSNAAQAIPNFLADFDNPGYSTLTDGMESLPRKLEQECRADEQAFRIAKQHTVKRITLRQRTNGAPYFSLDVRCKPEADETSIHLGPGPHCARNVILALPKEALKRIDLVGFRDEKIDRFRDALEDVTSHPAFKLFLRYDTPWWYQDLGWLDARATTDLPIRQVFYIGDSERGQDKNPTRKPRDDEAGLLMASYSDEHYVDFWDPLVRDDLYTPPHPYGASPRILDKAKLQLKAMHEGITVPDAIEGYVQEWREAWHFWNVHTKPWKEAERMIRPFDGINLFTCGEAYSLEQAWVEGALKSAERVLRELNIERPRSFDLSLYPKVNCTTFEDYIAS